MPDQLLYFDEPEREQRIVTDLQAQQTRRQSLARGATVLQAERVEDLATAWPHLEPDVIMGLAKAGLDPMDPLSWEVAERQAELQALQGDYHPPGAQLPPVAEAQEPSWLRNVFTSGRDIAQSTVRDTLTYFHLGYEAVTDAVVGGALGGEFDDLPVAQHPGWQRIRSLVDSSVSDVDTGDGWLPNPWADEGYERWRRARTAYAARHKPEVQIGYSDPDDVFLSPGRMVAGNFTQPGTRAYSVMSGGFDLAGAIFLDPATYLTGGLSKALHARRAIGGERGLRAAFPRSARKLEDIGAIQGPRNVVLADEASDWLGRRDGQKLVRALTEEQSVDRIWRAFDRRLDPDFAVELADARTPQQVHDLIMGQVRAGRFADKPGPFGMTAPISRALGQAFWGDLGGAAGLRTMLKATDRAQHTRILQWTPHRTLPVNDKLQATEDLDRLMKTAKLPQEIVERRIDEMARAHGFAPMKAVRDNVYEDIVEHIVGRGRLTKSEMKRIMDKSHHLDGDRAYWVQQTTGDHMKGVGARTVTLDGREWVEPTPFWLTEYEVNQIPLPNFREIRRAASPFARVLANRDKLPAKVTREVVDSMADFMSLVWQPAQLLLRFPAWLTRVTMEEQARMAAAGVDSMVSHPGSWLAYVLGRKGTIDITGNWFDDAASHWAAMNRRKGMGGSGWRNALSDRVLTDNYRPVNPTSPQYIDAWARTLSKGWNEPVARRVAGGLSAEDMTTIGRRDLDATSWEAINEWFWSGGGRKFRNDHARAQRGRRLNPDDAQRYGYDTFDAAMFNSREFAEDYLRRNYWHRIVMDTGGEVVDGVVRRQGDPELLNAIATGRLRDINLRGLNLSGTVDPESLGPRVSAETVPELLERSAAAKANARAAQQVKKILGEKRADYGPQRVVAEQDITDPGGWRGRMDGLVDRLFETLFAQPNDKLTRSPAFRQLYYRKIRELSGHMDHSVREKVLGQARRAGLDKRELRELSREMKRTAPGVIDDIAVVDAVAKKHALDGTKRLLYDVAERGHVSDVLRITNPFLEAWREILMTWTRLASQRPSVIRRAQQTVDGARGAGFFYEDEVSGEEMFIYPGGELITNLGLRIMGNDSDEERVSLGGRVMGLNLVGNIIPGFGPVVTMAANHLIPDSPRWDSLRDFVMPFGAAGGENIFTEAALSTMPAYMQRLFAAALDDPTMHRQYASTKVDVMRMKSSTGEYTNAEMGFATEAEMQRLEQDAERQARGLFLIQALAQSTLPTGPNLRFEVSDDEGQWFALQELGRWYREKVEEVGWDQANEEFVEEFGWDMLAAARGRSRATAERAVTQEGWEWERAHPEVTEQLRWTSGFYAPDPGGDFSIAAWMRQYDTVRDTLTPEQFGHLRNHMLGWMAYDKMRADLEAEDLPAPEQQRMLSSFRAELEERYPGFNSTIKGLEGTPELEEQIAEAYRAVQLEPVLQTQAGRATAEYLQFRDRALAEAMRLGITERGTFSANATQHVRVWLRSVGEEIAEENPEWQGLWERVFLREINRHTRGEEEDVEAGVEVADVGPQMVFAGGG